MTMLVATMSYPATEEGGSVSSVLVRIPALGSFPIPSASIIRTRATTELHVLLLASVLRSGRYQDASAG